MPANNHGRSTREIFEAKFAVLRTPLLPIDELARWGENLRAAAAFEKTDDRAADSAWEADVIQLRNRLRQILEQPEVIHALFLASPTLTSGIEHWKRDPDSKKGRQAERALVRYFARMAFRPMPFGLFSGCSLIKVDTKKTATVLKLQSRDRYRLSCRLDFEYLFTLTTALQNDPALVLDIRYWPNSSLYKTAGSWRYIEHRLIESRRSHHAVSVESDPYLDAVLERARNGATIRELAQAVAEETADGEDGGWNTTEDEATAYIAELIASNLLVTRLTPLVTGMQPFEDIVRQIESFPSAGHICGQLRRAQRALKDLEDRGISATPRDYQTVASALPYLPADASLERVFQVDMFKPIECAVLGEPVISEILGGLDILCKLGQNRESLEIKAFRDAFVSRYDRAAVPLLLALDRDVGVGFGAVAQSGGDASPLLEGLQLGPGDAARSANSPQQQNESLLRTVLKEALTHKREIQLDPESLPSGKHVAGLLPDAFHLSATLIASSSAALQDGVFELLLNGGSGPSGANLFGRFCHADPELQRNVREHLNEEESLLPDVVFAEIVYLPEGRLGNVLCRPVLRSYELPYLGRSGAPETKQLPLTDLLVCVEAGEIVLYSQKLNRRIIPRLTNAHGFMNRKFSRAYRFLCHLQYQHGLSVPNFSWGSQENLEYLPRVRAGRVVLSLARWRFSSAEISTLGIHDGSARYKAMQDLRHRRQLPRWVMLLEKDTSLPVDLDNPLSVDAFIHVLKRSAQATLAEVYPPLESFCVTGPEGHFCHEVHVPFVRRKPLPFEAPAQSDPDRVRKVVTNAKVTREERTHPPGSQWLYFKLYGGATILDDLLKTTIGNIIKSPLTSAVVSRWFFIRYADPDQHLRLRFEGNPERLAQELSPFLLRELSPFVASGQLVKLQLDTYEREIERYGGLEGMSIAEDIFFADSEGAMEVLRVIGDDEDPSIRWRIGLLGIDALLSDFGLNIFEKRATVEGWRNRLQREFNVGTSGKKLLGEKFRTRRAALEPLFSEVAGAESVSPAFRHILKRRSARIAPAAERLYSAAGSGGLSTAVSEILASYAHMHINRLIRSAQRAHEFVIYDFLFRSYDGTIAREGRASRKNAE
jgi:thiopeptide-type bacteriocin biosynthesis protein